MNLAISLIIALGIIYSMSAVISIITKKKIEICIPISIICIVMIIYPFGFFYRLDIGVKCILIMGIISAFVLLIFIIKYIRNKQLGTFLNQIITPGLLAYIGFCALFLIMNRNRFFIHGDEFSHWGLVVKNMYEFNSFSSNPETILMFKGYPPFSAIFEYFFLKITNVYREDEMIIALNILNISMIIPIFKEVKWKDALYKLPIFMTLIFLLPLVFFPNFYTITLVDATLGLFFVYILFIYFSENDKYKYIGICTGIMALPLIKAAGTGIAIFAIIIIGFDLMIFKDKHKPIKRRMISKVIVLITLLVCLLIGKNSWSIHLKVTNTKEAWNTSAVTIENIKKLIKREGKEYQYEVIRNFKDQFFKNKLDFTGFEITSAGITLVIALYAIATFKIIKNNRSDGNEHKRFLCTTVVLNICYIIYMISLMILYIYTYSEYEAVRLASYRRYIAIYLLAMFMFNTYMIIENIKTIKNNKSVYVGLIILSLLFFSKDTIKNLFIDDEEKIEAAYSYRESCKEISSYKELLNSSDTVYYISCGTLGGDFHMSRYELVPGRLATARNDFAWSVGAKRFEGDIWSYDITKEQFKKILVDDKYTYIYIYQADEIFKSTYGDLFEDKDDIKNKTLYAIVYNDNDITFKEV